MRLPCSTVVFAIWLTNLSCAIGQDIDQLFSGIKETSYSYQIERWTNERLIAESDCVVIAYFEKSSDSERLSTPRLLEGKDIEGLVSELRVAGLLFRKAEGEKTPEKIQLCHFRFRKKPVVASRPPHFVDFQQLTASRPNLPFVLFLKKDSRSDKYVFVAGDYFATLSVKMLADVNDSLLPQ